MSKRARTGFILVLFIVGFLSSKSFATRQIKDLLVYEGAQYSTHALPSLAECLPDVNIPDFKPLHTANHKGYYAAWAVIDGQLYLIGVEGNITGNMEQPMLSSRQLFPTVKFPHKVTSFNGTIEMEGRWLDRTVKEDIMTCTDNITLKFKNGKVIDVTRTTHTEKLNRKKSAK